MTIPAVDGRCVECGFDYDAVEPVDVVPRLDALPDRYERAMDGVEDARLHRRPEPHVWSPLEYVCHVRDVLRVQRERLMRALAEDRPEFARSGMWQWPERDGYNAQDPKTVLRELRANAIALSVVAGSVKRDQWSRTLVYAYPEPTERTILWLLRHTDHEGRHHVFDVERILGASSDGP